MALYTDNAAEIVEYVESLDRNWDLGEVMEDVRKGKLHFVIFADVAIDWMDVKMEIQYEFPVVVDYVDYGKSAEFRIEY